MAFLTSRERERVLNQALSPSDSQGVVYLDNRGYRPGEAITIGPRKIDIDSPTEIVFVDLRPGGNWGHQCKYILIDADTKSFEAVEAQFPPVDRELRVLQSGENVQEWMMLPGARHSSRR